MPCVCVCVEDVNGRNGIVVVIGRILDGFIFSSPHCVLCVFCVNFILPRVYMCLLRKQRRALHYGARFAKSI